MLAYASAFARLDRSHLRVDGLFAVLCVLQLCFKPGRLQALASASACNPSELMPVAVGARMRTLTGRIVVC